MELTIALLKLLIIVCLWIVTASAALFLATKEKWNLLKDKRFLSVIIVVLSVATTVVNIVIIVSLIIAQLKY